MNHNWKGSYVFQFRSFKSTHLNIHSYLSFMHVDRPVNLTFLNLTSRNLAKTVTHMKILVKRHLKVDFFTKNNRYLENYIYF